MRAPLLAVAGVLAALSAVPIAGAIFLSGLPQAICIGIGGLLWILALAITIPSLLPPWIREPLYWPPVDWLLTRIHGERVILIKRGGEWQWRCPYSGDWNYDCYECPCGAVFDMKRGRARIAREEAGGG